MEVNVRTGNTEVVSGVLHLFRNKEYCVSRSRPLPVPMSSSLSSSTSPPPPTMDPLAADTPKSNILCIIAVPSYMSTADFVQFVGLHQSNISQYRLLREKDKNRYIVLLKFHDVEKAANFARQYNNKPFNSMESETCQVLTVDRVEFKTEREMSTFPDFDSLVELPTCPVCLERMDLAVTGVFTLVCNHTFHCHCLSKWEDNSCPVCRYGREKDDEADRGECVVCQSRENLWMCLICGNIGCGRYQGAHASEHFLESNHPFAIELETQRVWDYVGDGYVHRLISNRSDGKLVELPGQQQTGADGDEQPPPKYYSQDKLESLATDYGDLLVTQLESQRMYFQRIIEDMQRENHERLQQVEGNLHAFRRELTDMKVKDVSMTHKLSDAERERRNAEKKLSQMAAKVKKLEQDLEEERALNVSLNANQDKLKAALLEKDTEIRDLQEQVKDLMFFLETSEKIGSLSGEDKAEIQNGQLVVAEKPERRKNRRR